MKNKKLLAFALSMAVAAGCTACGGGQKAETTAAATTAAAAETTAEETTAAETAAEETTEAEEKTEGTAELRIGQVEAAAHGDKCFAIVTAVIDSNDTIVASYIDEYQFLSTNETGVPNSESFAESGAVAADKVLASKRVNDAYYSEMMKKAGSTKNIAANFDEIQNYADGKTIAELEELSGKTPEEVVDAVSSATLVDTQGYVAAIVDAAKAAQENDAVVYEGDVDSLSLKRIEAAAHGDKCFTVAAALTDGTNVVLSYLDEYQFLTTNEVGVPNSESFAESGAVAEGKVLASKRVNDAYYSEMMKKAGSTKNIAENFDEIQSFVNGKAIEELEAFSGKTPEEVVDAVSSATLVDTQGYIAAIVEAAKQ